MRWIAILLVTLCGCASGKTTLECGYAGVKVAVSCEYTNGGAR